MLSTFTSSDRDDTRLRMLLFISVLAGFGAGGWGIALFLLGAPKLAGFAFSAAIVSLVVYQVALSGRVMLAASIWLGIFALDILLGSWLIDPAAQASDVLFLIAAASFIVFGDPKHRHMLFASLAFALVCWAFAVFTPGDPLGAREIGREQAIVIAPFIDLMIFLTITFELFYFLNRMWHLNALLDQSAKKAEVANVAKTNFLATVSHELRTPLNGIIGTVELLESTRLNDEQKELLSMTKDSSHNLLNIINDILDTTYIESEDVKISLAPVITEKLLESVVTLLEPSANQFGLSLESDASPGSPAQFTGDHDRIRRILINLTGNAIKFSHPELGTRASRISIRSEASGPGEICFSVTDQGIGIDTSAVGDLFAPFTQADQSSTRRIGGAGLGLTISKKLAEKMDGRIEVESAVGKGSTFRLFLPTMPKIK